MGDTITVGGLAFLRKGVRLMVTYAELIQFVIMLCAIVTLVLNLKSKK